MVRRGSFLRSLSVSRTRARIALSCVNGVQATIKDPSSHGVLGEVWVSRTVGQPSARKAGDSSVVLKFLEQDYPVTAIGLHTLNSKGFHFGRKKS